MHPTAFPVQPTHTHTHTYVHTHLLSHSLLSASLPAEVFVCKGNGIWWWKYPWSGGAHKHTRLLNFTDMAIWQKMCFFLCVAAGISACALTEMNDGKTVVERGGDREMLPEEILKGRDRVWDTGWMKTGQKGTINGVIWQENSWMGKWKVKTIGECFRKGIVRNEKRRSR